MSEQSKKFDLAALATIPLIMTLANSMLIPILPLIQKQLKISEVQSSLIITVYAAISIVFIPIAGFISDRFGRKKVILIGLTIAAIGGGISGAGAWLLTEKTAYWVILIGRFIQGIGAAGAFPVVIPLVGDMYKNDADVSKGLGIIETSNTFGKVLSPILGSLLANIIWFMPIVVIPFIAIVSIIAVARFVKEKQKKSKKKNKESLKQFIHSLKEELSSNKWLYTIFIIGGAAMFILFGFLYYLSSTIEDKHGIDGIWKGFLLAIPLLAVCISSFAAGKLVGKEQKKMKLFVVIGLVATAAAMIICGWSKDLSLLMLILLTFIAGAGIGFSLPCLDAIITENIEKEKRGSITSLYSSMRLLGVAVGPLVASSLIKQTSVQFYLYGGLAVACLIITLFFMKIKQQAIAET